MPRRARKKKEEESLPPQNTAMSEEESTEEEDSLAFSVSSEEEEEEQTEGLEEKPEPTVKSSSVDPPPVVVQLQSPKPKKREPAKKTASFEKERQIHIEQKKQEFLSDMGLSEYEALNFKIHIYRLLPEVWFDDETGEEIPLAGYLGESTEPVTPEDLRERFGQGTYRLKIWGPNKTGGASQIGEKKITISTGQPNIYNLPTDEPMEQRRTENARRAQARQQGRPMMRRMQQTEPSVSETLVDKTTGVLENQVRRLNQEKTDLVGRLEEKERQHKKEMEQIRREVERLRDRRLEPKEMDPVHKELIKKQLNEKRERSDITELVSVAKAMQPDLSGLTSSIQMMTDSVKQQMESSQKILSNSFQQTTTLLQQQMENQQKAFDDRMDMQRKQMEWFQEQASKDKTAPVDPRKELKDTLGLLTDVLELKKTLVGDDDSDDKDRDDDRHEGGDSPWWADKLTDVFGKALFQAGPAISSALGVPEPLIKEQIKQSRYIAGELQPADMSEEELEEHVEQTPTESQPTQSTSQEQPEQELDPMEVKLMTLVALLDEGVSTDRPHKIVAQEIYPLLKPFIKHQPAMLQAAPELMWSYMKNYAAEDSVFVSEKGRDYVAKAVEVVKDLYLNDNDEESGEETQSEE